MKQLSGQDNSFLEIERDGVTQNIASISIYDQSTAPGGAVRFKEIISHLESRLHLSPIFRSKLHEVPLGLDKPYLIDDPDFDLEYHVRHIALPKPGDWRQMCIQMARINSRPMDLSKPLWELYVIEGIDNVEGVPSGSFAVLLRMHHAIMDGATAMEMQAAIHDLTPEPRNVPPESRRVIHTPPSTLEVLRKAYINNFFRKPKDIVNLLGSVVKEQISPALVNLVTGQQVNLPDKPHTRFNNKLSPHRVLDACSFDFAEVRAIKNTLPGATVNDAVLTIVSGALHKYLKAHGELPAESLTCGCPVDVRTEAERGTGGNVVGVMGLRIATEFSDPVERFQAVHDASKVAKENAMASNAHITRDMMNTVPGGIMSMALRVAAQIGQMPYNTMVTNVPGPPVQLYFAGCAIVKGFGIGVLQPGMGLFHTCSSAVMNGKGEVLLSFWADRAMMPDPEFYKQCMQDSFDELKAATIGDTKPEAMTDLAKTAKPTAPVATKDTPKATNAPASKKAAKKPSAKTAAPKKKAASKKAVARKRSAPVKPAVTKAESA